MHSHTATKGVKTAVVILVSKQQLTASSIVSIKTFYDYASKGVVICRSDLDLCDEIIGLYQKVADKGDKNDQKVVMVHGLEEILANVGGKLMLLDARGNELGAEFEKVIQWAVESENPKTICSILIEDSIEQERFKKTLDLWTEGVDAEIRDFIPEQSFNFLHDQHVHIESSKFRLLSFADKISLASRAGNKYANPASPTLEEIKYSEQKAIHLESMLKQVGFIAGMVKKYGS